MPTWIVNDSERRQAQGIVSGGLFLEQVGHPDWTPGLVKVRDETVAGRRAVLLRTPNWGGVRVSVDAADVAVAVEVLDAEGSRAAFAGVPGAPFEPAEPAEPGAEPAGDPAPEAAPVKTVPTLAEILRRRR